jgi:Subtilisin inhibitor-like
MLCRLVVVSVLLMGGVADGWPAGAAVSPQNRRGLTANLYLTTVTGAGDTQHKRGRVLRCDPVGGDHPHRDAACRDIGVARGDFDRLPGDPTDGVCGASADYEDQTTVSATGVWNNMVIDYQRTFENPCAVRLHTGPVFDL